MASATPLRFTNAKPPADAVWPRLRPGSSLVDGILIERDVAVAMRDGIRIRVDVCRPRRELDPERSTPAQPVAAHRRDLTLPTGEPVAVDIEIWPFTATFAPGETLRLTVAGADIDRYPPEAFAAGHDMLINTAPHVLRTGGRYPSRLSLPVIPRGE